MSWGSYQISQLGRIITGKTPPSAQSEFFTGAIPFITPSDMTDDCRFIETDRHLSDNWDTRRKSLLPPRSVCVVCIGATIGKVCMTRQPSHTNQQVNSIIVDQSRFNPFFIYYLLRTKSDELKARAAGAATPIINKTSFSEISIEAPSINVQHKIGSILSAYDDLIEVNRRRVAVLEEMARGLFEEWFVRFRFPGHEHVPILDTPDGPLPEGWLQKSLFELATVKYGKNLPTKLLQEDGFPVYGASKVIGYHGEFNRENRTIICGCRGSVGEMQITQPKCFVTNNSFTFDPVEPESYFWIYQALRRRGFRDVVGGAAQPQITLEGISSVKLHTPPNELRGLFQRIVAPMFEQSWVLDAQNKSLSTSRDLLLPRLISGELSVARAERELEEVA